jgi:raffinose/stachyose/melibiose transport system substrate-binding protein
MEVLMKSIYKIVVFFVFLFMVGCKQEEALPQKNEIVEFEFFNTKKETQEIMNHLIKEFEHEYPNIRVNHNTSVGGHQTLLSRFASNNVPDVFIQWPNATWEKQVEEGFVLELTNQKFMDRIDSQVRQEYQINGGDYILPLTYNTSGVFYNINIYEELGLSIPQDFESLLKNAEIIEQSGTAPFSFMGKDHLSVHQQWYALLPSLNDYDGFIKASLAGDVSEYREELALLTQQFLRLSSYGQEDMLQTTNDQAVYNFAQGKSAMLIMGSWKIPWIKQINQDINFAMFPIPKQNGAAEYVPAFAGDFSLCVSSKTEKKEAALLFLEFISRVENMEYFCENDGSIPVVTGVDVDIPELSLHKKYLNEGRYRTNADAYWSSQTNELLAEQVQKLLLTKDRDSFVDAIIRIFKESQ